MIVNHVHVQMAVLVIKFQLLVPVHHSVLSMTNQLFAQIVHLAVLDQDVKNAKTTFSAIH